MASRFQTIVGQADVIEVGNMEQLRSYYELYKDELSDFELYIDCSTDKDLVDGFMTWDMCNSYFIRFHDKVFNMSRFVTVSPNDHCPVLSLKMINTEVIHEGDNNFFFTRGETCLSMFEKCKVDKEEFIYDYKDSESDSDSESSDSDTDSEYRVPGNTVVSPDTDSSSDDDDEIMI